MTEPIDRTELHSAADAVAKTRADFEAGKREYEAAKAAMRDACNKLDALESECSAADRRLLDAAGAQA